MIILPFWGFNKNLTLKKRYDRLVDDDEVVILVNSDSLETDSLIDPDNSWESKILKSKQQGNWSNAHAISIIS